MRNSSDESKVEAVLTLYSHGLLVGMTGNQYKDVFKILITVFEMSRKEAEEHLSWFGIT